MIDGKRAALVLSGGASYAAYEVGVVRALTEGRSSSTNHMPLDADIFSGTSAGSFNASIMVGRSDDNPWRAAEYLEDVWLDLIAGDSGQCGNGVYRFRGDVTTLFSPSCLRVLNPFLALASDTSYVAEDFVEHASRAFATNAPLLGRTLNSLDFSSIVSIEPFEKSLRESIDLGAIRNSNKLLQVAATNLETGSIEIFENRFVADVGRYDSIRASSAVPVFFPEVQIGNNVYVDGGVLMNTPMSPTVSAGAEVLHVIYMDPDLSRMQPESLSSTLGMMDRLLAINFASNMTFDAQLAQDINKGLQLVENVKEMGSVSEASDKIKPFLRVAGRLPDRVQTGAPAYRSLTIHRYHPTDDLGGILGMLNFERQHIIDLIDRGFHDAVHHNCVESGCTLEGREPWRITGVNRRFPIRMRN